jgi:signal transduction histidine kinase
VDAYRLQQILINLIANGVKFTPAGGSVAVVATGDERNITIAVSDTGIGMDADQLEHIFQPFYQADQTHTRAYGGVGLGLAISKELARLIGAELHVESEKGAGTMFQVVLPRADTVLKA